jgi:hypothetical protein
MTGIELITAERKRQIEEEGWTQEHDAQINKRYDLSKAAICYADPCLTPTSRPPFGWPWSSQWWKPKDQIRNLTRAGALIAAEIDRLQADKGKTHA